MPGNVSISGGRRWRSCMARAAPILTDAALDWLSDRMRAAADVGGVFLIPAHLAQEYGHMGAWLRFHRLRFTIGAERGEMCLRLHAGSAREAAAAMLVRGCEGRIGSEGGGQRTAHASG